MLKQIRVCDCCGKELKKTSEIFHLDFKTDTFLDAAGSRDYNFKRIDLCDDCAEKAVESLKIIAEKSGSNFLREIS